MEADGFLLPGSVIDLSAGGPTAPGLAAIKARDPGFDETAFVAWVEQVHFLVTNALNALTPENIRRYVADGLYTRLVAQAADSKQRGSHWVQGSPAVTHSSIIAAHTDASYDTIVVRLNTEAAVTLVDAAGKVQQGDPDHRAGRVEHWTFQRSATATTSTGALAAGGAQTCPQCGAPLSLDSSGACTYCRAVVTGGQFDWVLVRTEVSQGTDLSSLLSRLGTSAGPQIEISADLQKAGRSTAKGVTIFVVFLVLLVVGVVVVVAVSAKHAVNKATSAFTVPGQPVPASGGSGKASMNLALSGAIGLAPSDLSSGEFLTTYGLKCPPKGQAPRSLILKVVFDSGDKMNGVFTLPPTATGPGTFQLTQPGASAVLNYSGATQATLDNQTWTLPNPAPAGTTATVTVNPDGSGTLKWESFPSVQADHHFASDQSGLGKWTCG